MDLILDRVSVLLVSQQAPHFPPPFAGPDWLGPIFGLVLLAGAGGFAGFFAAGVVLALLARLSSRLEPENSPAFGATILAIGVLAGAGSGVYLWINW